MGRTIPCDVAIVGGGLAGGLIARALRLKRPGLDVRIVEAGPTLGGDHVWSFFGSDVMMADRWLLAPLVVHGWRGYAIAFPHLARQIDATYYSLTSERLDAVLRRDLAAGAVMLGRKVLAASATAVVLADGDRIESSDSPLWSVHPTFSEFFDGDTGEGLGATHQTGWTALVAHLLNPRLPPDPRWS